jgi:hypothetical protein
MLIVTFYYSIISFAMSFLRFFRLKYNVHYIHRTSIYIKNHEINHSSNILMNNHFIFLNTLTYFDFCIF